MSSLLPLSEIPVPRPRPDETYRLEWAGLKFAFKGLKALLGAADYDKAGDRQAGLAATDEPTREAARRLLSDLTLQHLYDRPLVDKKGQVDAVMRVNYQIDLAGFRQIASLTVGELKDRLLRADGEELRWIGRSLTGVMVAAVAKLLDVHELVCIPKKISCSTKARTRVGQPGTLSSRLQPNHPTDDLRGITLLMYAGLSVGSGDILLGVNPAIDTVESVGTVLRHLDKVRRRLGVPTQICVLSHIKTQLAALEQGAPVEILFQSLAGTESTLSTEFDVTVDLLDQAYETMKRQGPLGKSAEQTLYFETGQGSELTYGKHDGIDMATTEALCYGLARRYDPFMVNNVTGFIGPETHLDNFEMIISNLQDHFMGKLLGLPMGMAPCYTLHSKTTLDGQQMATQLLTAAGANYYMDVCHNTDRMLAYFDTSGHDDQTLREVHGKTVASEYLEWAIGRGIFARAKDGSVIRGAHWGDAKRFCESEAEFQELLKATPAMYGFESAGPRPANAVSRRVRANQATAREAVYSDLDRKRLAKVAKFRVLETEAKDRDSHLGSAALGARLCAKSAKALKAEKARVQIVVSDGLSAEAVNENIADLLPLTLEGLAGHGLRYGRPMLVPFGRVKVAEAIAQKAKAELTILFIGERPGGDAVSSRSLSAYFVYKAKQGFEYSVISNIYSGGLPPLEASSVVVERAQTILKHRAAGNRLEKLLATQSK